MPNWRRIKRLRNHLVLLKPRQVRMETLLIINKEQETVKEARRPECGTVGCLAGHTFCLFANPRIVLAMARFRGDSMCNVEGAISSAYGTEAAFNVFESATELLSLSEAEASFLFYAHWHSTTHWSDGDITKKEVIAYLDKAIAAKDVMVTL